MTRLDEFLEPLHHGVWEVVVPNDSVTEPLDSGWEKEKINVASPGTIVSYRKGQYHVHETTTEWRVHLDRHDPKLHREISPKTSKTETRDNEYILKNRLCRNAQVRKLTDRAKVH
jgi:hypothetical protein